MDTDSWTDRGIRDKVGASHLPLAALLNLLVDTGFGLEVASEGGGPGPDRLVVPSRQG